MIRKILYLGQKELQIQGKILYLNFQLISKKHPQMLWILNLQIIQDFKIKINF